MTPSERAALHRRLFQRRLRRKIERLERPVLVISLLLVSMIFAYILCTHSHKPQSNEQIISPIPANEIIKDAGHSAEVRTATPSATPTPMTDEQMIKSLPHGDLVWKTYGHESTYGKFDGCKAQGKFNGFGYAQSKFGYQCFDSLKEVATKVSNWFTEKLQIMTVDQALCYYNTGKHLDTCEYAEYSKSL